MGIGTNKILTSLHGHEIGLNENRNLVIGGQVVSDKSLAAGTKNTSTTIVEEVMNAGPVRKVKLTFTATPIVLTDESGVTVWSGTKIYDFPAGFIMFMGACIDGDLTGVDVAANWVGDVALGTATADNTATPMVTVQEDLLPNTAIAAATAKVGPVNAVSVCTELTETNCRWFDGRSTAKDMYLNFLIDENGANATTPGTFTGTVEFAYMIIGNVDPA